MNAPPTLPPPPAPTADTIPDEATLVTEDGKPVDNVYSEKQMRLLTEPLYAHWAGPAGDRRYVAMANVGLFYSVEPPVVPDVLLSVGVTPPDEFYQKAHRSYFMWRYGKAPDVVIEVVSNREGGEDTDKLSLYARIGVPFYAIHDPENHLRHGPLRHFKLTAGEYEPVADLWMPRVGLGLTLWHGAYEGWDTIWLRWCDRRGDVIPTGAEQSAAEKDRADAERQRAEAEKEQAAIERTRAEAEKGRADAEKGRADTERERAEKFLALLREKGIDPSAG